MKSNRDIQNERLFSAEQFRCTLRSKLGAGPIENTPHTEFTCQCNAVYCPRDGPFHGCHFNVNASFCMRRHNEIQRAIRDYTKKGLGLPDQAVHLEAYAGTTAGTDLVAPKRVITSLLSVIVGAETLWIDVSVVDPGCHRYIGRYRSNEVPDAVAKAMETTKRIHHSVFKDPLPFPLPLPPPSIIHHPLRA